MELTIEQALQQGVAAHKEGKLEEAERLYRAILKYQPAHPDANHNLGVIAVSVNKAEAALPLFKSALEANPKIEQFWLSYIDALIKEQQFEVAKQVIQQGNKQGVDGERLNSLEAKLSPNTQKQNTASASPPQELISSLLEHYKTGRFNDAEKLAISITQEFPKHQFAWKMLGAVFGQTGRNSEAVHANQRAVALSPRDAAIHSNLGVTLQQLGRLEEAEVSYIQAIALKPGFAGAYYNLGVTLQRLGRLCEAEASYTQAIALSPDYAKAHSNLGVTLQQLGRLDEAEASCAQAIALKPDFFEAHYNLGNTFKELRRLEEAEASYTQAIALKPDYAEAHSNLGAMLQQLGRLEEAEARCAQAIALKPDYAEAHSNLGVTLQQLGRLCEAEASCAQAIALKPGLTETYNNLGSMFKELGRLNEAEASYIRAITLKSDYAEAMYNLAAVKAYMDASESQIFLLKDILRIETNNVGLKASVDLAICYFLKSDFINSKRHLLAATKIQEKVSLVFNNEKVYQKYLLRILNWHEKNYFNASNHNTDKTLYVIGESHSLVSHQLHIKSSNSLMLCKAKLIKGCTQWHLGNSNQNPYKYQFESIFCSLPKYSEVLLAIGEIDCRLDSGIIKHKNKFPQKEIKGIITTTVENYLTYIEKNNSIYQHNIIIQGVPCPNINKETYSEKEVIQLINVIKKFNCELKSGSKRKGFDFLDLHKFTDRGDGFSNAIWHVDQFHLSPEGMKEAWRRYAAESHNNMPNFFAKR